MKVEQFTRDHTLVVQAAYAYRNDQPLYAEQLWKEAEDPLYAALEILGLLMTERAEGRHAEEAQR